jgi:hypothetical protein
LLAQDDNASVWDPTTIFKGVDTATSVVKALKSLLKGSRGVKRALLLELQGNIQLILLYREGHVPIDKLIRKLEVSHCKAALESNFNFASLERGRVSATLAQGLAQFRPYVGWTTEQLFSNIYLKITELQSIVDMDSDGKQFRKGVRLLNVFKLMLLLLKHLKS